MRSPRPRPRGSARAGARACRRASLRGSRSFRRSDATPIPRPWPCSPFLLSGDPAGDRRRLLQPAREPLPVDILVLVDVEITRVGVLRSDRGQRVERRALEEADLDIAGEAMEADEQALPLAPGEGRV